MIKQQKQNISNSTEGLMLEQTKFWTMLLLYAFMHIVEFYPLYESP